MLTSTLDPKVALNWYEEKESVTSKGVSLPYLVINSENNSILGIPLIPKAVNPFSCSFFLKGNYAPGILISRYNVQRGELDLNLALKLPENTEVASVFFHKATISLINKLTDKVLGKSNIKAGKDPHISFSATLDEDSADQYYRIIKGLPSALHLLVEMTFYVYEKQELKCVESIQPLSKVIMISDISRESLFNNLEINYYDKDLKFYKKATPGYHINPLKDRKTKGPSPLIYTTKNNVVGTNHAILQPVNTLAATSLVYSPAISLSALQCIAIDNVILTQEDTLPKVDNPEAIFFIDNKVPNVYWAIPKFEIVHPQLNDDPLLSPFRFLFRQKGMDNTGKPVLEGEVTFSLKVSIPQEIKTEILGQNANAKIRQIEAKNIAVNLEIPFYDVNGTFRTTSLVTEEFRWNQDVLICTFRMSNEWIRICYGLLSATEPAAENRLKINLAYTFDGLGVVPDDLPAILMAQNVFKIATLAVITKKTKAKAGQQVYFNAESKTLTMENGQTINFGDAPKSKARPMNSVFGRITTASTMTVSPAVNVMAASPALNNHTLLATANSIKITDIVAEKKYVQRTFLRKEQKGVNFECVKYGAFYQEQNQSGDLQTIGCKEPYKLGEIKFSLYTPLNDIRHPDFKVYQSTQIPNRFLVVPRRFVITRFEPGKSSFAFQPCLRLYSTLDAVDLSRSRCVLDGTLAPDINRFDLEDLHFRLSQFTPYTPFISFPGEIEHTESYDWAIPDTLAEDVDTFTLGTFVRMVLGAKIEGFLTLQTLLKTTGIAGKVTFTLPDQTLYSCELLISLDSVNGPFLNGALITEKINSQLKLKNGLIHQLQLTEFHAYKNYEDKKTIPIERTLKGGEEVTITIDSDRIHVTQYVVEKSTETLEESRQYLEDIECQVLFVTSIDFTREKLKEIKIFFGLSESDHLQTSLTKDKTLADEKMIMPLTDFFNERKIKYSLSIEKEDGSVTQGAWITVSLASEGNIINITTSAIQPS